MKKWLVASAFAFLLTLGATPSPTVAQDRAAVETTRPIDVDDDGGKWGWVGLLGLLGLMGLKRRDKDRDYVKRSDTR